ncbi:hypothetical protein CHLNCDRAFT_138036 [Chlorella variabilis]|uniref:Endonuclease/exonuclease/phosphatase domain-containing protein n=1 Tax=Chlorella variabilis TaxID=554065 RepID=E1Z542_CHLVA|nr:hypothetical protein CHLNCDRAFT_138036 [Chlorella variabilis]EFN59459.1 hypothetical protein CHLNCDRAFT_138036 [Chlorella variabilis]|eukprot:XP_005851561.1 hypothetical protein CHLNCDRAFT_138036 [Chlorella variabilis]
MFKVFTLNVSAGNLSAWAPAGFSLLSKYEAIVELIKHHSPQLISLQELDSQAAKYFIAALGSAADAGWQHLTQAESHCHSTHIWAAASLQAKPKRSVGPVAIAQIQLTGDDGCFYFAGCHLEPYAQGACLRLQQIAATLRSLPPRCRLVLAGDCNMRNAENSSVEALGLGDAFKQAGSPPSHSFTWNSTINKYHGADQRAYTGRYDRIYLSGFVATELQMVANQPMTPGHADYLSDHFGLVATVQLLPQQAS